MIKGPPPSNRRIPRAPEPADDSPAPAAVSKSVRPPAGDKVDKKPRAPKGPGFFTRVSARLTGTFAALKLIVGIVVVVGASAGVAWAARRYVLTSPRFAVKMIAVEGVTRSTPEHIAEAGGVAVGDNVLAADLEVVARKIEAEPWIASAQVQRKLPGTLSIQVVEHEPYVVVALGGDPYLATRDGVMFKRLEMGDPADLPMVTGIKPEMVKEDREGAELVVRRAADVVRELADSAVGRRWPVQEVHVEKDGTCEAIVGREGIALHLGLPPYKPKVQQAERVLNEIGRRRANASIVFLDNDANPDRVVVRMR